MFLDELCLGVKSEVMVELSDDRSVPAGTPRLYICPECGTAYAREDILDGLAIRRFGEVYCRRHFRQRFPRECENHPGTRAEAQCSNCGRWACSDCIIDLLGRRVCRRCKSAELVRIEQGVPGSDSPRVYKRESGLATAILVLGVLGWVACSALHLVTIILYVVYRRQVARGEVRPARRADVGFALSVVYVALLAVLVLVIIVSEAY